MIKTSTIKLLVLSFILLTQNTWSGYSMVYFNEGYYQEIPQDSVALKTLYDSAKFYSRTEPILSKNLLHKLISISKSRDSSGLYEYYTMYGNACVINCEFDAARYYYYKALDLDKQQKDTLEQARIYNNFIYLYKFTEHLDLALENAHEGIRLLEIMRRNKTLPYRIKSFRNKTSGWVLSKFYSNIGEINMKVGNYKEALYYYKKELAYLEKTSDKIYYACALNDIASVYRQLKQYDRASLYCQKAISVNKEIDNEYGIGVNYQTLGDIFAQTEKLNDAKTLLNEGLEILEKSDDISARSLALLSFVSLEIKSKHYDNARQSLAKCFELIKASSDLGTLKEYYYYKFKLDSINGKRSEALASYIKYHELDKQIVDIRLSQRIAEIQANYEMQQKEQENKLLKTENEVQLMRINKSRAIIFLICGFFTMIFVLTLLIVRHQRLLIKHKIIDLKQKNLNQQMNPHFVYNCLTSIQLYILHNNTEKSLEYLSKFSKLMRKILESSQNQYMSVQDEIEILSLYLKLESIRFKGKFDYNITIDEKIDPILFKIPSLLIQPFVENSLWHGIQNKTEKGKIHVSFDLVDKSIFCVIEDNGIGRENAEKIKHNCISDHISLGSSITQSRMKLLKSLYGSKLGIRYIDLKDNNNKPSGTRVELFLPILN